MKRTFGLGLVTSLVLFASAASADTLPAARYAEMMTIEMMDTNKDGMVSREEYLEAAGKMFDMAVKHMKAKEGKMNSVQLREYRSALATGK